MHGKTLAPRRENDEKMAAPDAPPRDDWADCTQGPAAPGAACRGAAGGRAARAAYFALSRLMASISSLPMRPSMLFCTGASARRHSACSFTLSV